MQMFRITLLAVALGVASSSVSLADSPPMPTSIQPTPTTNPDYEAVIDKRTNDIIVLLDVTDDAQKSAVHSTIMTQYRSLNAWHEANDARRAELRKIVGKNQEPTAQKKELDAIDASLLAIHNWYLATLGEHLSADQIVKVKDKMTYGKVMVTYNAYLQQQPTLTDEEKAHLLQQLELAREEGMDAGSSKEKDAIFDKYKGRINNWLSKNGHQLGGKKPTTPASQPAK